MEVNLCDRIKFVKVPTVIMAADRFLGRTNMATAEEVHRKRLTNCWCCRRFVFLRKQNIAINVDILLT